MSDQEQNIKDILENVNFIKDNAATKQDVNELREMIDERPTREDFAKLQESVDNYAKKADTYFQELAALRSKINRLEDWITKIAKKVNIELTS